MKTAVRYSFLFIFFFVIGVGGTLLYFKRSSLSSGSSAVTSATPLFFPVPTSQPTIASYSAAVAPAQSLVATIASHSGDVQWQSRTATEAGVLMTSTVQQGEELSTGLDGRVDLQFPAVASLSVAAHTQLNIIQTLPSNIVVEQPLGSVAYTRLGQTPISIRSWHLLATIESGNVMVTVDPQKSQIVITVREGAVTVGFNSLKNITTTQKIPAGMQATYDEPTRTIVVEKSITE